MKKTLLVFPLLAMMAVASGGAKSAAAETFPVSSDWTVVASGTNDETTVYDTANGYMMDHVNSYQEGGYFNKKVPLDGLSFDIRAENIADGDFFGFCLSRSMASGGSISWTTPTVTLWKGLYGSQTRVVVTNSHDYNAAPKVHISQSLDSKAGFKKAGSAIMYNDTNMTSAGINVSFKKCNEEWYKITLKTLDTQGFWPDNNEYDADENSCSAYIPVSYMIGDGIDETGKTYIHYTGLRSSGNVGKSDITVYIENLKYDFKSGAIKEVNAVDSEKYDAEDKVAIEAAKTTALAEIDAAVDEAAIEAALAKFNAEVAKYKTADEKLIDAMYEKVPDTMGVMDNTANFKDSLSYGYSSARINDEGGFVAKLLGNYGQRGAIANQYDPKNFEMTINFSKMTIGTTAVLSVTNDACGYINDSQSVFGMDIVNIEETRYFVTFTNSGSHNISVEGFGTETWHSNQYTGRYVTVENGNLNIKVTTVDNVATVVINNVSVELDASSLFAHQTGEKAWFSLGIMTANANEVVAVTKIKDAAEVEYLTNGTFAQVVSKLEMIEPAIANGVTNEIYAQYYDTVVGDFNSHVAHLEALFDYLHGYDKEYFRSRVEAVVAAGEAIRPTYESKKNLEKVITGINELGEVTLESKDKIEALEAMYATLLEDDKALVTNYDVLVSARATLDALLASKARVDAVVNSINEIGVVTVDSKDAVEAAETAYDALSETEKAQVTNHDVLVSARTELDALLASKAKVDAVVAAIEALGDVTLESKDAVEAAEAAYDALTDVEKDSVINYNVLVSARESLDVLLASKAKADAVVDSINAVGEVTLESKDAIEAAEAAYNALSEEEKALVTNHDVLVSARESYDALVASKARVDAVIEAIDAIGTVTKDSEAAINNAETAYNALSDAEKAQVTNHDVLVAAKAALEELNNPTSTSASTPTSSGTSTGEKPADKGCRGSIVSTSILVGALALGGVMLSLKKKKEDK